MKNIAVSIKPLRMLRSSKPRPAIGNSSPPVALSCLVGGCNLFPFSAAFFVGIAPLYQ